VLVTPLSNRYRPRALVLLVEPGRQQRHPDALAVARQISEVVAGVPTIEGWTSVTIDTAVHTVNAMLVTLLSSVEPGDALGRVAAARRLLAPFAEIGPFFRLLPIADWASSAYRDDHPLPATDHAGGGLLSHPFDLARHQHLQDLRARLLQPWLRGELVVRDPAAFAEYHLGLGPGEQFLIQYLLEQGSALVSGPCASGCHPGPLARDASDLVARGWVTRIGAGPQPGSQILERGPKMARLNRDAGEFLEL
jgi:hypothetical protein